MSNFAWVSLNLSYDAKFGNISCSYYSKTKNVQLI